MLLIKQQLKPKKQQFFRVTFLTTAGSSRRLLSLLLCRGIGGVKGAWQNELQQMGLHYVGLVHADGRFKRKEMLVLVPLCFGKHWRGFIVTEVDKTRGVLLLPVMIELEPAVRRKHHIP